ncbi:MAG TPA: DNA polymerase III subunit alpha [Syntrophales bacterium]|nr:DNA polymerase III subunit alpha [Syntrophales bacterium]
MKHADFVHLHLHTQYSLLDGMIRLQDLFKKAKQYRMPALAVTDHGNIYGAVDFYQQALKAGIKPIIGCELYVAPGKRTERNGAAIGEAARHLVVLARNQEGYRNLMRLTTVGFLEGFYYRPRVDREILGQCAGGLIGMSACLHGEIPDLILKGEKEAALACALSYREIFGADNFFLEIMENDLPEQKTVNEALIEISRRTGIPLVATNDCHYLGPGDAEAHEILLCIQTGKTVNDGDRMRFTTDQFYLRSPQEMEERFSYCPEALRNTVHIAERCNLTMEFGHYYLPHFRLENGKTLDEELETKAREGLARLLPAIEAARGPKVRERYEKRLEEELRIIKEMGFSGYFLIVADFVNYAKGRGIPVGPGRGSAAGSIVAYATGITNIDPIRYGLFFERFLNPDRVSMPDIDIDFCQEGREEVIRYVTDKYGTDRVAQIITFGKMQARAVIRDVGRAMGLPYNEVDAIAKLVPNKLDIKIDEALEAEPRLREEAAKNEKIAKLIGYSRALEGLNRHSSTHAAGVVISDVPLVERVPLCKSPKGDVVTQFSMNDLQTVGLTKFDFLGLKTLTVINKTLRFLREERGINIDMDTLPLDDKKTYELLQRGETDGVFQLESSGMKDILVGMKPDCIGDLIALIALYRPGPMKMVPDFIARKAGKTPIHYEIPELEEILKETYGVILYQEQVMQIAGLVGDYSMAEADTLRKVMSKKKTEEMEREKPKFLAGARKKRVPEATALKIWEQMETFAEYGFNKSHSTAYAMISYQTAYLKAHYPVEFMAALLTSEKDNRDKFIRHISSCRDMGIKVLPPDINLSQSDFSVSGGAIRFGLAAVKNVGEGAVEQIIAVRREGGPFKSFEDFCRRVDLRKVNKRVLESLIKCGAFDSLGYTRRSLMAVYEKFLDSSPRRRAERMSLQASIFDDLGGIEGGVNGAGDIPPLTEWEHGELLSFEKETIRFYITSHPLQRWLDVLPFITTTDTSRVGELMADKETLVIAGVVGEILEKTTKKKETMAHVALEDLHGSVEMIFLPEIYRRYYDLLHGEEPLVVKGTVEVSEDVDIEKSVRRKVRVKANEVQLLAAYVRNGTHGAVRFYLESGDVTDELLNYIKELSDSSEGLLEGYIHLLNGTTETIIHLGADVRFPHDVVERHLAAGRFGRLTARLDGPQR